MSPVWIFSPPTAVSEVRSPSRSGRRSGDRRSAARTPTIPVPARSGGHPSGTAAALAADGTARYKDTRGSGDENGFSNLFSYREPLLKVRNPGITALRVASRTRDPHPAQSTQRNQPPVTGRPPKTLIYMALA